MLEIFFNKDSSCKEPVYVQLYKYIKKEIIQGRLKENEKLPSIRKLSHNLNLSKTTIENAYNQLIMEGYIYSISQKGYYVSHLEKDYVFKTAFKSKSFEKIIDNSLSTSNKKIVDKTTFEFNLWRKYLGRVLIEYQDELLSKASHQGEKILREQITDYVYKSRGVICNSDQVIVGAGVQVLLSLLCAILKEFNCTQIAFENPGFKEPHKIFKDHSIKIEPVSVNDDGIDIIELYKSKSKVCYVSPSHQFPTGLIMPISIRTKLLKWASDCQGLIIEDDYDSELRYNLRPVPSLQGLDKNDRVIYLGSFSTVLLSSMRLSYMILPKKLVDYYDMIKNYYNQTASKLDQIAVALFIKDGEFERHIRKLRNLYSKKNEILIKSIKTILKNKVELTYTESGLYLLMKLKHHNDISKVIKLANREGISLKSMSEYTMTGCDESKEKVLLFYRGFELSSIKDIVNKLNHIIK